QFRAAARPPIRAARAGSEIWRCRGHFSVNPVIRVGNVLPLALHWPSGAARCVRSQILGALSILKGAVPDRTRGFGYMAPTYFRREPGIATPTAERLRTLAVTASSRCRAPRNDER